MRLTAAVAVCVLVALGSTTAFSHSDGTNAVGCHTNRTTGDFHCHTPKPRVPGRVTYCHVVFGEDRCGYARSTCRNLVRKFGGTSRRENEQAQGSTPSPHPPAAQDHIRKIPIEIRDNAPRIVDADTLEMAG